MPPSERRLQKNDLPLVPTSIYLACKNTIRESRYFSKFPKVRITLQRPVFLAIYDEGALGVNFEGQQRTN
jgi:hypothetical protein